VVRQVLQADRRILETVGRWHQPTVTLLMRTLTRIGDASTWVFVSLVLLAVGGTARHCGLRLAAATAIATMMSQILKRTCRRPRPSSGIGGFIALAFAIALSRVYLGAHYPLDVAVGASVGAIAGAFVRILF